MTTTTRTRSIPTPAEAKAHPLAKTVRKASIAAKRDGRPYFVMTTYSRYAIESDEGAMKFASRYFRVFADRVEEVTTSAV